MSVGLSIAVLEPMQDPRRSQQFGKEARALSRTERVDEVLLC